MRCSTSKNRLDFDGDRPAHVYVMIRIRVSDFGGGLRCPVWVLLLLFFCLEMVICGASWILGALLEFT